MQSAMLCLQGMPSTFIFQQQKSITKIKRMELADSTISVMDAHTGQDNCTTGHLGMAPCDRTRTGCIDTLLAGGGRRVGLHKSRSIMDFFYRSLVIALLVINYHYYLGTELQTF